MDWHKLQHKLFAMDPVDPRTELENLRKAAQNPTPMEEPDLIKESYEIKPGTMPLGIDSISEFAALAGIRIDEKQLKGPAGQAKGSDPMPAAKLGRTKHPLKDKLVGEKEDRWANFKQGYRNYNDILPLGSGDSADARISPDRKNAVPDMANNAEDLARSLNIRNTSQFSSAVVRASQGLTLTSSDKQILGEAFQNLLTMSPSQRSSVVGAMANLTSRKATAPVAAAQPAKVPATKAAPTAQPTATKQQSAAPASIPKAVTVTSSRKFDPKKTTIKEHLTRLLEEKKLK